VPRRLQALLLLSYVSGIPLLLIQAAMDVTQLISIIPVEPIPSTQELPILGTWCRVPERGYEVEEDVEGYV
jgi:hypothetical protein